MINRSVRVLGSTVHLVDLAFIRRTLAHWIDHPTGLPRQMIVTGFHGLWRAYQDPNYRRIARSADMWVPDGIAPVAIARLRGIPHARRTPGTEIMRAFFELAQERSYSSFFYGDTPETLERLNASLRQLYPRHRVAGLLAPPFRPLSASEDAEIVERVNAAQPDVVWVGLGMPKQDIWASEHKYRLNTKIMIGVGAAFGFMAGTVRRCPDWIGNMGFEWAYRLLMEPRKLWRRDLLEGPAFLSHVFFEHMGWRTYD